MPLNSQSSFFILTKTKMYCVKLARHLAVTRRGIFVRVCQQTEGILEKNIMRQDTEKGTGRCVLPHNFFCSILSVCWHVLYQLTQQATLKKV